MRDVGDEAMLGGMPEVFRYASGLALIGGKAGGLAVVIHYLMGDVILAAEHALTHYLPISLDEHYLQNSSLGTPYVKWAKFTTEDFQIVDECMRRMLRCVFRRYTDVMWGESPGSLPSVVEKGQTTAKQAARWFRTAFEEYHSCIVATEKPVMVVSELKLEGWVDERLCFEFRRKSEGLGMQAVVTARLDISDREVVRVAQRQGLERVGEMRLIWEEFGLRIRDAVSLEEFFAEHRGTLSEFYLGRSENA